MGQIEQSPLAGALEHSYFCVEVRVRSLLCPLADRRQEQRQHRQQPGAAAGDSQGGSILATGAAKQISLPLGVAQSEQLELEVQLAPLSL